MKELNVLSNDGALIRAVKEWWRDCSAELPDGSYYLTDLDDHEKTGAPYEVTVSHKENAGADLLRPFPLSGLLRAFRAAAGKTRQRLAFADGRAYLDGEELRLSPLEEAILRLLHDSGRPMGQEEISLLLTGRAPSSNKIGVYISYLRKKTRRKGRPELIVTVRGRGYVLNEE